MYQVYGQFLGEVITGKDGDLLSITIKEGGRVSYKTMALEHLAAEHILTSSPWGSPADSSWRVHPHHQSIFPWIYLPSELWPNWSPPVHGTITLRLGEWVLPRRAGMKPVLETGLALPASTRPQTHSKSTEMNSCVSTYLTQNERVTGKSQEVGLLEEIGPSPASFCYFGKKILNSR